MTNPAFMFLARAPSPSSGRIVGGNGTAIQFNASGVAASDTLNILPGARFGGLVNFAAAPIG